MPAPALSIVMPVLNEVSVVGRTLEALKPLLARGAELLVVDGGSTDGTQQRVASAVPQVCLIGTARGRALQMNAGAAQATGELLLFLHADTVLPDDADDSIQKALVSTGAAWGRFDVHIEGQSRLLPMVAAFMNVRSRWFGIATGDQAMFITRAAFEAVGGFALQPLMEDIEMSKRLRRLSRPACVRATVRTSGRRWDTRGPWRTVLLMWRLRFAYWRGVPAERLAALYK